jgi:hypothetical protein
LHALYWSWLRLVQLVPSPYTEFVDGTVFIFLGWHGRSLAC